MRVIGDLRSQKTLLGAYFPIPKLAECHFHNAALTRNNRQKNGSPRFVWNMSRLVHSYRQKRRTWKKNTKTRKILAPDLHPAGPAGRAGRAGCPETRIFKRPRSKHAQEKIRRSATPLTPITTTTLVSMQKPRSVCLQTGL